MDIELRDEVGISNLVDYCAENDLPSVEGTRFEDLQKKFVGIVFEDYAFWIVGLELAEKQWQGKHYAGDVL